MRTAAFTVAAVACVSAIVLRALTGNAALPLIALVVAAGALVLGIFSQRQPQPGRDRELVVADLHGDQQAEIRRLLDNGQYGTAVKQVQLWFRHADHASAEAVVQRLR